MIAVRKKKREVPPLAGDSPRDVLYARIASGD